MAYFAIVLRFMKKSIYRVAGNKNIMQERNRLRKIAAFLALTGAGFYVSQIFNSSPLAIITSAFGSACLIGSFFLFLESVKVGRRKIGD